MINLVKQYGLLSSQTKTQSSGGSFPYFRGTSIWDTEAVSILYGVAG